MKTLGEMQDSPIGTMCFTVEALKDVPADRRDMDYRGVHYERNHQGIKIMQFYAATADGAHEKTLRHDAKRKEIRQKWRDSAKERRQISRK